MEISMTHTTSNQPKLLRTKLTEAEYQIISQLRDRKPAQNKSKPALTVGERWADRVAATVGSWRFVMIQSALLTIWIILNITAYIQHWDPYPFILLNLMLSFQAAYTAPIIMMSQNRQSTVDRQDSQYDYEVNLKAELEIELLHEQIHNLKTNEIAAILNQLQQQQKLLKEQLR
jgi:uncharacterized membrane protein